MEDHYRVNNNAQPNGDHEVHKDGCWWLSQAVSTTPLGWHNNCSDAVTAAKRVYWQSNGYVHCVPACHTS